MASTLNNAQLHIVPSLLPLNCQENGALEQALDGSNQELSWRHVL
jgi:hypothetical protein